MKTSLNISALLILLLLVLLPACKPTEKNYQQAYAVAQHKKATLKTDPDLDLSQLIAEGEPDKKRIGDTEIFFSSEPLKTVFSSHPQMRYNVAVGCYRMRANAEAQAEQLIAGGRDAYVSEGIGEKLYVICGGADSEEEALSILESFTKSFKDAVYPGLDGHPLLILNTALHR